MAAIVWQCPVGVNICGNMYQCAVDKQNAIKYFDKVNLDFYCLLIIGKVLQG